MRRLRATSAAGRALPREMTVAPPGINPPAAGAFEAGGRVAALRMMAARDDARSRLARRDIWGERPTLREQTSQSVYNIRDAAQVFCQGVATVAISREAVSEALNPLRQGFQADGADLEVDAASVEQIVVRLVVTPQTCFDCIVPKEMLTTIVETQLRETFPGFRRLVLVDPRLDA